jgi:hypothetical protein
MASKIKRPKAAPRQWTAEELFDLLALRHPSPSWVLLSQVANGTGWKANRWADAMAMACWPSLGLQVHGYEIKVSRYDLRRELADGAKSQALFQYSDRWWLVLPREDCLLPGELPPTWGLLVPKGGRLVVAKDAPTLSPKALDKFFIASVLRNAAQYVTPEAKLKSEYERGREEGKKDGQSSAKQNREEFDALKAAVSTFEKAAGIDFGYVYGGKTSFEEQKELGMAVRLAMSKRFGKYRDELVELLEKSRRLAANVEKEFRECEAPDVGSYARARDDGD